MAKENSAASSEDEEEFFSIPLIKGDISPGGELWTLENYHAILDLNVDSEKRPSTIGETKQMIRKDLHINLYDLLNWFRNPDTSPRPQRFNSIEDLAAYSYTHNKVFPRYEAACSSVANPLLRPIGDSQYKKLYGHAGRRNGGRGSFRGVLGRKSRAAVIEEVVKSTAENEHIDKKIEDGHTSSAAGAAQKEGPRRKKRSRGPGRTIQVGESDATPVVETPVVAATA